MTYCLASTDSAPQYLHLLFLFNLSPPPAIYILSLHDALPIFEAVLLEDAGFLRQRQRREAGPSGDADADLDVVGISGWTGFAPRSEEHTSELQSRGHLVCRLLLEKKKAWRRRFWTRQPTRCPS